MIEQLFAAIDAKDASAFAGYLSDECTFRFGNQEPVLGRAEVENYVGAFFESIQDLEHRIEDVWSFGDAIVCHGMVTYTRRNGSELTVPFANVFMIEDRKIREYLIFADTSALYTE